MTKAKTTGLDGSYGFVKDGNGDFVSAHLPVTASDFPSPNPGPVIAPETDRDGPTAPPTITLGEEDVDDELIELLKAQENPFKIKGKGQLSITKITKPSTGNKLVDAKSKTVEIQLKVLNKLLAQMKDEGWLLEQEKLIELDAISRKIKP